jgi:hypothetical protein
MKNEYKIASQVKYWLVYRDDSGEEIHRELAHTTWHNDVKAAFIGRCVHYTAYNATSQRVTDVRFYWDSGNASGDANTSIKDSSAVAPIFTEWEAEWTNGTSSAQTVSKVSLLHKPLTGDAVEYADDSSLSIPVPDGASLVAEWKVTYSQHASDEGIDDEWLDIMRQNFETEIATQPWETMEFEDTTSAYQNSSAVTVASGGGVADSSVVFVASIRNADSSVHEIHEARILSSAPIPGASFFEKSGLTQAWPVNRNIVGTLTVEYSKA